MAVRDDARTLLLAACALAAQGYTVMLGPSVGGVRPFTAFRRGRRVRGYADGRVRPVS